MIIQWDVPVVGKAVYQALGLVNAERQGRSNTRVDHVFLSVIPVAERPKTDHKHPNATLPCATSVSKIKNGQLAGM